MTWEQIIKRGYGKKFMHPVSRQALSTVKTPSELGTIQTIIREHIRKENEKRAAQVGGNKKPKISESRAMLPNSRLKVFINKEIRLGNMRRQGDRYLWVGKDL